MKIVTGSRALAVLTTALLLPIASHAQTRPCDTASKFGPDDEAGNVRYITPDKTRAARDLITTGKVYSLAIETNNKIPAYPPRTFSVTVLQPDQAGGGTLGPTKSSEQRGVLLPLWPWS